MGAAREDGSGESASPAASPRWSVSWASEALALTPLVDGIT